MITIAFVSFGEPGAMNYGIRIVPEHRDDNEVFLRRCMQPFIANLYACKRRDQFEVFSPSEFESNPYIITILTDAWRAEDALEKDLIQSLIELERHTVMKGGVEILGGLLEIANFSSELAQHVDKVRTVKRFLQHAEENLPTVSTETPTKRAIEFFKQLASRG